MKNDPRSYDRKWDDSFQSFIQLNILIDLYAFTDATTKRNLFSLPFFRTDSTTFLF